MDKIVFGYSDGSQYKTIALSELGARRMQLNYNVDSPDTLQIVLSPENYEKLPISPGGKINVTYSGEKIFAGTLAAGAQYDYDAGAAPSVTLEFLSDYHLLDSIAYAALDSNGEAVFSRRPVKSSTTSIKELVASIETWIGNKMSSSLTCVHSDKVPTPQSNGTASCAALLGEAMRWTPSIMLVQRYASTGDSLTIVKASDNRAFYLTKDSKIQSLSVRARYDLRVPVCALVGGARGVWPASGDIRTPGAFVYAVPVAQQINQPDAPQRGAGESPASAKMVVRGVKLPDKKIYTREKSEYAFNQVAAGSTSKFIKRFFPELAPLEAIGWVGACFVNAKTSAEFKDELDDDDASVPKNYDDSVESWGHNIYVHTEGSFPAAADSRKNVKGLRWCKAQLSIVFAVKAKEKHSELQKKLIAENLPGKQTINGEPFYFVKKTLTCTLINRRKKVYDPATGALCSSDPHYAEDNQPDEGTSGGEQGETLTAADYKAAMAAYYESSKTLQYEGSANILFYAALLPWELTGRRINITGFNKEWETMDAVIRSVSWDVGSRKVGISFGPRAVMGFDEILERRTIARNTSLNTAHETAITYDPADAPAKEEAEEAMSVSPSISASNDTNSIGRYVKPLTLYLSLDNETVMLAGGVFYKNGQKITVPDTDKQIKEGEPSGAGWQLGMAVKSKIYTKPDGTLTYDIFQ